jgi:L-arabinose isomerase
MVDFLSLRQHLGPVCWPVEPEKFAVAMQELGYEKVQTLIKSESARYKVDMDKDLFEKSCRLALALEKVTRENKFDALAIFDQIWLTDPSVGIIPSYGTGRLCEIGIPCSTEADVTTLVAMLILQELAGQVTFLENYVIDFPNNSIILSHDGHGNPALASEGKEVTIKSSIYYEGVNGFGAAFEFAYAAGPVTMMSLVSIKNRWRLIYSEGESIQIQARPIAAPQMLYKPKSMKIQDWCNAWCTSSSSIGYGTPWQQDKEGSCYVESGCG